MNTLSGIPLLAREVRQVEENGCPTINMVRTGENIVKLRQQKGLSVKDLQEIFGFATPQAICKWQHGRGYFDGLILLFTV